MTVLYGLLADGVLVLHLAFVVFVVAGGFLALWRRWVVWIHLPAVAWGGLIEFTGWICPLTPLENALRELAGESGYKGGFIEHYLLTVLYPSGLTRTTQVILGLGVVLLNLGVYAIVFGWWSRLRGVAPASTPAKRRRRDPNPPSPTLSSGRPRLPREGSSEGRSRQDRER